MRKTRHRSRLAQSIIETVVGIIFLIPIVLFLFDVAVLVLGNTANDNLAKNAARAAASAADATGQGQAAQAFQAAGATIQRFATSSIIPTVQLVNVNYEGNSGGGGAPLGQSGAPTSAAPANPNPGPGLVSVMVRMDIQPPVPFPGVDKRTFYARAVEPIVSKPPI
jgi:hypothetical protein